MSNNAIIIKATSNDSYVEVSNNIIYNTSPEPGYAFEVSMGNGLIDYNWIYDFGDNLIDIQGGSYSLDDFNQSYFNVTDINPMIKIMEDTGLSIDHIDSYKVQEDSRCFGTGIYYENVGIDENNPRTYSTVVDTFFDAKISYIPESNFMGNVFIEDVEEVNSKEDFPFWKGNDFYNKDIYYVIKNRKELEPFENIWCPANPGYGFPEYKDYETGLFGYPRINYINNCGRRITEDNTTRITEDDIIRTVVKSYTEEDDYYGNQFNWSVSDIENNVENDI